MPHTTPEVEQTEVGSYFVANYPPFSVWTAEAVDGEARPALAAVPAGVPLGLYLQIPFCRKRCHFCYFRVYTDKDAAAIRGYLDAVLKEFRTYAGKPFIGGRKPKFVYFGGGTPSYLSPDQLKFLTDGMKELLPWDAVEEVTFEAEPGTLRKEFGASIDNNATHGSDAPETAAFELSYFFRGMEMV